MPTAITRVAAVQMVSSADVADNLQRAAAWVAQAAADGAQFVALPEHFAGIGARDADKRAWAERVGDPQAPIQSMLARTAAQHRIWLLGGSLPLTIEADDAATAEPRPTLYNTSLLVGPDGRVLARYDKLHLFSFRLGAENYDEGRMLRPGARPVAADVGGLRLGLSICYDLRFPELYRALGTPDVIAVPSAFTVPTGRAHWHVLLRARAIENQAWVVAAAQGGLHDGGRRTYGHTLIIDPWGDIVAERSEDGEGIVAATLDPARMADIRARLPALAHRRDDLRGVDAG